MKLQNKTSTMESIVIRQEILEQIKASSKTKNRLAYEFDVHHTTITRWVDTNDITLTTAKALKIISEELNMNQNDILQAA